MQPNKIAVIGAGTMGTRIAAVFAARGFAVSLYSRTAASLEKAEPVIRTLAGGDAPVTFTTVLADCLSGAGFVSENIAENLALKQEVFRQIEQHVGDDCLLTTNTSSVPIGAIATVLRRPQRFIGLHWFNPADVMPMLEIVRGPLTGEPAFQQTTALCRALGKTTIAVDKDVPGFIVNRLQYALLREALHLVSAGIGTVEDVDFAVQSTLAPRWSAMGPMKLMDFAGLDTVRNVAAILLPELANDTHLPAWVLDRVEQGHLGVKSGRGFYVWSEEEIKTGMEHRNDIISLLTAKRSS
ncbi:3-hydroxyacyl-CoA dehydrogenase family protein [Sodalis sp. RH22]|uniref:3-hydroxyacyl-CoA dehydrogenase family protein n=1 Tax=unclassified Sodalis (in: enterobacteria) TaxID=2636512 RepID=UPI0039B47DA3